MKKRILIMLLIFTLLLGAFSINAFADDTEYEYEFTLLDVIDVSVFLSTGSNTVVYSNGEMFTEPTVASGDKAFCLKNSSGTWIKPYVDGVWVMPEYKTLSFPKGELTYYPDFVNWLSSNSEKPHEHFYSSSIIAPTCTEKGYTSYTCECGDTYIENEVEALGHSYSSTVTAPSCSDTGFTTHTCTVCGDNYTDTETAALGHNYSSVTTPSTCTVKGYNTYTCSACGDSYIGESLDLIPHNYVSVVTPPTVTKKGFTTHTCSMCGDNYIDSYVDELPSSEDTIISVWDEIFNDFISLFGSAQTVFYDGKSITFLGALVLLALGLGLAFLLISVIVNFLRSRG